MKRPGTTHRALFPLSAFAALAVSPVVWSQSGVPPIEMTLEQFNQGRPANFYFLADASEGYEAVCEEVLEALNEPYPGEPYAEYNEPYSKYLLRSRLSVPWVEIPDFAGGSRNSWNARYVSTDINNDGAHEDVFLGIFSSASFPVHQIVITKKEVLPTRPNEIEAKMWIALRDKGDVSAGSKLAEQVRQEVSSLVKSLGDRAPEIQDFGRNYFDVVDVNSVRYIVRTTQSSPEGQKNTFIVKLSADEKLKSVCWLTSRYSIKD